MKCPKFTLKEVDLHKWRIFFRDSLIGETSFPVPSEKIGKCIVQAINSHEKLVELLKYPYSLPMNEAGDYDENCKWKDEVKQALKEAEKEQ